MQFFYPVTLTWLLMQPLADTETPDYTGYPYALLAAIVFNHMISITWIISIEAEEAIAFTLYWHWKCEKTYSGGRSGQNRRIIMHRRQEMAVMQLTKDLCSFLMSLSHMCTVINFNVRNWANNSVLSICAHESYQTNWGWGGS